MYLAFLSAAFMIVVVPGPTNLAILSDSLGPGAHRALWTVLGAACSHALFIILVTAGLAALLVTSPQVLEFVRWFGVAYLVWTGLRLILSSRPAANQAGSTEGRMRGRSLYFLRGFLVNGTNPKALIFYTAFFPPFVSDKLPLVQQLLILGLTFLAVFGLVGLLHVFLARIIQLRLQSGSSRRRLNLVAGGMTLGAGIWLATR